ncbi:hypothetical protein SARC_08340 [Sphaeroforma arctica JP610]|uniref:Dipeptidyl peptidase 1 n=1 Tax=Sphaeroforma arctica JP610 TaxID=667725 RepID=A0A0L0FR29_9EUKA|nr:hypothetical protein SARC_08340 [Sphaeroforma arctica JP610]KNC79267.1 hypothetical protein SARC_08340 [Sphaeroforma arctica JP610]|eukprot:XP_014153169.1 hypothetical protein SARC_08340 [Sphaeroforma arctica JP610]
MSLISTVAAVVGLLASVSVADVPADCRVNEIKGSWLVRRGPGNNDNTITCNENSDVASRDVIQMSLLYPNIVSSAEGHEGNFTLVYNQAFEAYIDGVVYFAFVNWEKTPDYGDVSSIFHCGQTMTGWYHDYDGSNWGCFKAQKMNANEAHIVKEIKKPPVKAEDLPSPADDANGAVDTHADFVQRINAAQNEWQATEYEPWQEEQLDAILKFRTSHGAPDTTSYERTTTDADYFERRQRLLPKVENGENAAISLVVPDTNSRISLAQSAYPESFDWRDVDGVNYVSPVRNQDKCGSCYAFAAAGMLEARIRIESNNALQPVLSPQEVLNCSPYTQGCSGGFSYLVAGKHAKDFGLVEEDCVPYNGAENECPADKYKECTRWKVSHYSYVGGYYGNGDEEAMIKELVENGPMTVGFEVYPDFKAYKIGVYSHTATDPKRSTSDFYEIVNHAVLVVGYGVNETTGTKYWTVKNSWGPWWGMDGYFNIKRGSDEAQIESMPTSATVMLP